MLLGFDESSLKQFSFLMPCEQEFPEIGEFVVVDSLGNCGEALGNPYVF